MPSNASPCACPNNGRFAASHQLRLDLHNRRNRLAVVERTLRGLASFRQRQAVLVILQQQAPRLRITHDERQHRVASFADQCLIVQRARQQLDSLLRLGNPPLRQARLVQRVALYQMLTQGAGRPLAELHAPLGINAVADGDDDIEIVVFNLPSNGSVALGLNLCKFCTSCRLIQLTFLEHIVQMLGHHRTLAAKQRRHLLLRQPYRLRIQPHIHPRLATLGFIDQYFAHDITYPMG